MNFTFRQAVVVSHIKHFESVWYRNTAQTGNTGHIETYPGENLVYDTHHRSQGIRGSDHHGYQINDHHSNRIKDSNPTAMAFSKVSQSSYKLKASCAIPFISRAHHPLLFSF